MNNSSNNFNPEKFLDEFTFNTGKALENVSNIWGVKQTSKIFGLNWLTTFLGEVDTEEVKEEVEKLKKEYPLESREKINQRIIFNQSLEAAKIGLFTNIIPPFALALLGFEIAAMTKLQAQMVYKIADSYDFDLNHPSRRGETLGILALSLGGGFVKGGLSFVEILPFIGPLVGASTNAATIYALGLITSKLYETKSKKIV